MDFTFHTPFPAKKASYVTGFIVKMLTVQGRPVYAYCKVKKKKAPSYTPGSVQ